MGRPKGSQNKTEVRVDVTADENGVISIKDEFGNVIDARENIDQSQYEQLHSLNNANKVTEGQPTSASHYNDLIYVLCELKSISLLLVDALHEKDGDSATWKPIRDKIEAL